MSLDSVLHAFASHMPLHRNGATHDEPPTPEAVPPGGASQLATDEGSGDGTTKTKAIAEENQLAAWLLTGLTILAGVFTALGITEGMVGRMARNEYWWTILAFAFVLCSVFVAAAAAGLVNRAPSVTAQKGVTPSADSRKGIRLERWMLGLSLALLLVGGVLGVIGAAKTWGETTVPRLAAHLTESDTGPVLTVQVNANSLHAGDRLTVLVSPLVRQPDPSGRFAFVPGAAAIYKTSFGPDVDGTVDKEISVPLVAGRYHRLIATAYVGDPRRSCNTSGSNQACAALALPEAERPQLSATWTTAADKTRTLGIHFSAHQIARRTAVVRVFGTVRPHRTRALAEWSLAPNSNGNFDASQSVPVPKDVTRVCVVASTAIRALQCPQRAFAVDRRITNPAARRLRLQTKQASTVWLAVRAP